MRVESITRSADGEAANAIVVAFSRRTLNRLPVARIELRVAFQASGMTEAQMLWEGRDMAPGYLDME